VFFLSSFLFSSLFRSFLAFSPPNESIFLMNVWAIFEVADFSAALEVHFRRE